MATNPTMINSPFQRKPTNWNIPMAADLPTNDTSMIQRMGMNAQPSTGQIASAQESFKMPSLNGQSVADLSSLFGAFSSGKKADRQTEGDFTQGFDQQAGTNMANYNNAMINAQTARNQNELDAWKKMQGTSYILGGGANLAPPTIQSMGRSVQLPSFDFGMRAPSEEMKTAARNMQPMLTQRLQSGGSFVPQMAQQNPLSNYANPGVAENVSSYAGAGLGLINGAMQAFGGGSGSPGDYGPFDTASGMAEGGSGAVSSIMGKAAPYIGLASGTAGLIANKGLASNVASGASAGFAAGSILPGIGNLAGAGIGAGVGALRSLFSNGPSAEEKDARQVKASVVQQLGSMATPEEQQEAQSSGWQNPQDALAVIVMRNRQKAAGLPDTSSQLMQQLYSANKKDPSSVQAVGQQIFKSLGQQAGPMTSGNNFGPSGRPQGW